MPGLIGRLWRSAARRAEVPEETGAQPAQPEIAHGAEMGRRLEQARERLRQSIPPPDETDRHEPQT